MPTYIVLANYTDQGVKTIKAAPQRMEAASKRIAGMGGKIKDVYYTLGQYDFVVVFEFPNDDAFLSFAMQIAQDGNVRFTTMKAYPRDNALKIIQGLP